jgi:hypothetical protein
LPAAAEGFDEGDGGGETTGGGFDEGAACGEFFLLGVGDFEEVDETVAVAFEGEGGIASVQAHRLDITRVVETAGQRREPVLISVSEAGPELPFEFVVGEEGGGRKSKLSAV